MPKLTVDMAYWDWKASILPLRLDGAVLDVGCYEGHFSRLAKERGAKSVIGIEPPIDNVEADYDSLPRSANGVTYRRLSLYDAPTLGKFEHVIFFDVLYHLMSPVLGLKALRSCLAPGGHIYICTLYAANAQPVLYALEEGWHDDVTNWFVPTVPALQILCQRAGLEIDVRAQRGDRLLGICRERK